MAIRIRISRKRPEERGVFGAEIGIGKPALPNMVLSVFLHMLALAILSAVPSRPVSARESGKQVALSPTEIRIDNHIYFVAELSADHMASELRRVDRASQAENVEKSRRRKTDTAANLGAQAPPLAAAELRGPHSAEVLIQPGLPPDLAAPATTLPTFRVWTEQTPLVRKAFVTPGRQNPAPPGPAPHLEPPDLDLVHADPVPVQNEAKLVLPRPPSLVETAPSAALSGPQPIPIGDPVNVLSVSERPQPASDRLLVPPVQMGANGADNSQAGARMKGGVGVGAGASRAPASQTASNINPGGGKPLVKAPAPDAAAAPVSNPPAPGTNQPGSGSSPGSTPSPAPSPVPGSSPGQGLNSTSGSASPQLPGTARVTMPRDGNYEVVVTQNAGVVPGSADFLGGRPVYSVYLHAGGKKDWILQYCLPVVSEAPRKNSVVVRLSDPAPVGAPYAVVMLRPAVTFAAPEIRYAMLHGMINAEGRFEQLSEVGDRALRNMADVVQALSGWEFRPATKDGIPIVVEVVLCIPNISS